MNEEYKNKQQLLAEILELAKGICDDIEEIMMIINEEE